MKLTLFNGSPRGKGSNTKILLDHFQSGLLEENDIACETCYLNLTNRAEEYAEKFRSSDDVIIAFPLYTDSMPGIVKHFIEKLQPYCGDEGNPRLGIIIQSGFPEPTHSRHVQKYMEKLAERLGCEHTGTVIRGGVEGIQMRPKWMTSKLYKMFHDLGVEYAKQGRFDQELIKKLAPFERMSSSRLVIFKFMKKIGISNFYWDLLLKKNNAYEKRFAKPFKA